MVGWLTLHIFQRERETDRRTDRDRERKGVWGYERWREKKRVGIFISYLNKFVFKPNPNMYIILRMYLW